MAVIIVSVVGAVFEPPSRRIVSRRVGIAIAVVDRGHTDRAERVEHTKLLISLARSTRFATWSADCKHLVAHRAALLGELVEGTRWNLVKVMPDRDVL